MEDVVRGDPPDEDCVSNIVSVLVHRRGIRSQFALLLELLWWRAV